MANTFEPPWLPPRWRHPVAGYVLAALFQSAVAGITCLLIAVVPTYSFPGLLEILSVALIAVSWGAGPCLLAALVGLGLEEFLVLPSLSGQPGLTSSDLVEGVVFLVAAISINVIVSTTERSRRHAVEQRAQAQAQARATQQIQAHMDGFLSIASHDLRTPLTAAVGFSELAASRFERLAGAVRERVRDLPDLSDQITAVWTYLDNLDLAIQRLSRVARLLFDTAEAATGTVTLHPTRCDLGALVQAQVRALRLAHPDRTLRLELADGQPILVMADADRIGQVVANYLTNALKYSPATQPIEIEVAEVEGTARVAVKDHGPGLPANEQERVWQRFYRAEGVQVQSGSGIGLGLGLHICRVIIAGHGGAVGIDSMAGHGSTFWFTLPCLSAP